MDAFGLKWSMDVKDGCKRGVVAGDKFIQVWRWVSYENRLRYVRNEIGSIDGINATKGARSSWLGWRW